MDPGVQSYDLQKWHVSPVEYALVTNIFSPGVLAQDRLFSCRYGMLWRLRTNVIADFENKMSNFVTDLCPEHWIFCMFQSNIILMANIHWQHAYIAKLQQYPRNRLCHIARSCDSAIAFEIQFMTLTVKFIQGQIMVFSMLKACDIRSISFPYENK